MQKKVIALLDFVQCAWQRFQATGCSYRAAALSFAALLSLIPLMTFGFSILAKFPQFKPFSQQAQNFIFANFLASSAQMITTYLHGFMERAQLSLISLLLLLITATLLMLTLEQTFNSIWQTPKRRHWTLTTISYWLAFDETRRALRKAMRSRRARDRRALLGEAGNASRRKVMVGGVGTCASSKRKCMPNAGRIAATAVA